MGKPYPKDRRREEVWTSYDLGLEVTGTAFDLQIIDVADPLQVTAILEPSGDRYRLEFDRMSVIAYLVGTTDRVNRVPVFPRNTVGEIYCVKNSDFAALESEWEGQYEEDGTYHLVIPAVALTIEILTLEYPIAVLMDRVPISGG